MDWWHTKQWRLIQTNLREIDMRDIRADQVVRDLQSFKANVLMINAAGIIASYPTKLPFHFQSPYLTSDSLQAIIAACHEANIRVIARTDFSKIRRPIYEQHPDWAYVSPAGQIVDYNGDVHACINGPYQQERAFDIINELLSTHPFDGIFFNMGGYQTRDYHGTYHGICQCLNCRRRFYEQSKLELPKKEDPADPTFRRYDEFRRTTSREHSEKVSRFITSRWPAVAIANATELNRGFIRQESNTAIDRPLPHWQYSASDNTKWAVGSHPEMVSSNTTVDFIDFPYRHVTVSPDQQALRLVQSLANGGTLDYYLIGRLDNHQDRSGFAPIRDIFHYHAAHESDYIGLEPVADVLLIKSGGGEYNGWFRTLVEGHFLFDVMLPEAATARPISKYKAILLPDLSAMSDELAARLDAFVNVGGTVIATGQTSFRDSLRASRQEPAMRCLGVERILSIRENMRSSYLQFTDKGSFPRMADVDLVYLDGPYIQAQYAASAQMNMRLIPPHRFGPPERCYYEVTTDLPGFVTNPFGAGRAIYLTWLPGALFHRQGHVNTSWFCSDLLEHVAGILPLGGNLPPQVEATVLQGSGRQIVHLINGTGHFGNSFYPPVPLHDLQVTVPLADRARCVTSLRSGSALPSAWAANQLTISIPRLDLFDAVLLEKA